MRKVILVLAIAATSFAGIASAATWHNIYAGNDKTLYFFDADTVEKSGNSVTLWVKDALNKSFGDNSARFDG